MSNMQDLDELFEAFEKMLGDDNPPPVPNKPVEGKPLSKEGKEALSKYCKHEWIKTGCSPFTNAPWENCKHCDIAREKAEK